MVHSLKQLSSPMHIWPQLLKLLSLLRVARVRWALGVGMAEVWASVVREVRERVKVRVVRRRFILFVGWLVG